MTGQEKHLVRRRPAIWVRLSLLMAGLACASLLLRAGMSTHLARAERAYQTALRLKTRLQSKPLRKQTETDYEKVIQAFRDVYLADPNYSKSPVSLAMAGELYSEMGRRFHSTDDSLKAVKAYQFLGAQYPGSSMARRALFTVGEIYRNDLQDNEQARKAFQQFLDVYPHSEESRAARDNLRQIVEVLSQQAEAARTAPVSESVSSEQPTNSGPPELTDIRDWVGPNYTRVVIAVQKQVKFDTLRLSNPDRIVLDIQGARLSRSLVGKTYPVGAGFLQEIRVGQFKPDVARVVLDVQRLENYTVFPLPNPFRLIIDIHGPQAGGDTEQASRERLTRTAEKASAAAAPKQTRKSARSAAEETAEVNSSGKPSASEARGTVQSRRAAPGPTVKTKLAETSNPPTTTVAETPSAPRIIRAAAPTANGTETLTRALGLKVARIVIDPGHGGHDTGAIGPGGLEEKNVVLDVAKRLRRLLLTKTDAQVFMTRSTDKFIPLEERTAIANEDDADLFISIHANANPDPKARGIATYYLNFTTDPEALAVAARENATSQASVHQLQSLIQKIALTEKVEESQEFARDVQHDLVRDVAKYGDPEPNRGVKKAPFVVLIGANMPSILAEISFITNPHDDHELRRGSFRQEIAEALFQGILTYMRNLGSANIAERVHPAQPSRKDPPHKAHKASPGGSNF